MALFKSKEMAAPQAAATPREKVEVAPGVYTAECMKIGQLLVEANQMSHDNLATALQLSNGERENAVRRRGTSCEGPSDS